MLRQAPKGECCQSGAERRRCGGLFLAGRRRGTSGGVPTATAKSARFAKDVAVAAALVLVFAIAHWYIAIGSDETLLLDLYGDPEVAANANAAIGAHASAVGPGQPGHRAVDSSVPRRRPSWVPITDEERRAHREKEKRVCGKPFKHCCTGQGRQLTSRHGNISQLEVKWSEPLAGFPDLLDHMSDSDIACNLFFVGQSTSGDQLIGALCELAREWGYELDPSGCVPYRNERWKESSAFNCTAMERHGLEQLYQLTNPRRSSCPKVTLAQGGHWSLWEDLQKTEFFRSGGVMIVNRGMHCNEPGCVAGWLGGFADRVLPRARERGWRVLWRETERQHFASPTGYIRHDMTMLELKEPCAAIERTGGDYRNEEAEAFLRDVRSRASNMTMPIVRLADATVPLHFMHAYDRGKGIYDCTHYVYTPWRFQLTWDGILKALKDENQL